MGAQTVSLSRELLCATNLLFASEPIAVVIASAPPCHTKRCPLPSEGNRLLRLTTFPQKGEYSGGTMLVWLGLAGTALFLLVLVISWAFWRWSQSP
jgi:hypothetical protein